MLIKDKIKGIIYSSYKFYILKLSQDVRVKITFEPDFTLEKNSIVEFNGEFVNDIKFGETFIATSATLIERANSFNILALAINGISEKRSQEILDELGSYTILKENPLKIFDFYLSKASKDIWEQIKEKRDLFQTEDKEELAKQMAKEIKGIGKKKVLQWIEQFEEIYPFDKDLFLEDDSLMMFLSSDTAYDIYQQVKHIDQIEKQFQDLLNLEIPQYVINFLFKDYKNVWEVLSDNPYLLLDYGLPFSFVDNIALTTFNVAPNYKDRIINAFLFILINHEKDGNTFLEKDEAFTQAKRLLNIDNNIILDIFEESLMDDEPELILKNDKLYRRVIFFTERKLGILLNNKTKAKDNFIPANIPTYLKTTKLSEKQQQGVLTVLSKKISILTGGPGTGKTTTINEVCNCLDMMHKKVLLCAPTGRAAKRMTESTKRLSQTIHRLLDYKPRGLSGAFMKNEKHPLDADYIIVDESSMLDVYILNSLIKAIKPETSIIFVGDVNQLPSVSMGSVFRDMKDSNLISVFELTEVFRQSLESYIVRNAYHVNNNESLEINNNDFKFIKVNTYEDVRQQLETFDFDYQILCPMRIGDLGTININKLMQSIKNKSDQAKVYSNGRVFKVNDKIIQNDNDYNKEVFNGEIGEIISINDEETKIKYVYNDPEIITYKNSQLYEIDFSYAISIHKSQGSEADNIVLIIDGNKNFLSKELIYTAITRAKKNIIILSTYDLDFYETLETSNNRMTNLSSTINLKF